MIDLPWSQENEMAVLASMIERPSVISDMADIKESDFYMAPHREIYRAIIEVHNSGLGVDLITVSNEVSDDCGGIAYITDMCKQKSSPANVSSYVKLVINDSIKRQAIESYLKAANQLAERGSDFTGLIAKTSEEVDENLSRASSGDVLTIEKLIEHSTDEMYRSSEQVRVGISTGIPEIDERLGYQHLAIGEITYFGAPSKNGKTLFANTVTARSELLEDEVAHVFSIEMPAVGMFNGIVSAISGVPGSFYARQEYYHKMYPNRFDEWFSKWGKAAQELNNEGRITIDDRKDVTMAYIVSEMRKRHSILLNKGKKLKLVVIDHLHRIQFDTSSKPMTYAMGDDVRMLKNVASELGIAVLLLGQLNENSRDREPTAFDILDTSRVRHEIQCFIGFKIFREDGRSYFGIYSDAQRYADQETKFTPAYVEMIGGVIRSLPEHNKHWTPKKEEN